MSLRSLLGLGGDEGVHALYMAAVAQARQPVFYTDMGVPDTVDGRFDMIALFMFLILRRLKSGGAPGQKKAQELFDLMFDDMDRNLREMGVGDLSVGRKVKEMATLLYGRIAAYETALAADDASLEGALTRNLYRNSGPSEVELRAMAAYLRAEAARSEAWPLDELMAGRVTFEVPVVPKGENDGAQV